MAAKSSSKYESLMKFMDNRADGMALFDVEDTFFHANRRFAEILGYPQSELEEQSGWQKLLPEKWQERSLAQWKRAARTESFRNHQVEFTRKNKGKVQLLVNGGMVEKRANGNHLLFVTVNDVTDLKKDEQKLVKTSAQANARVARLEDQLKEAKQELQTCKKEVARTEKSLEKINEAMKLLIVEFQDQKSDLEHRIVNNFHLTVGPILEHLRSLDLPEAQAQLLDTLDFSIRNITSYFGVNIARQDIRLSPREVQICQMIREGKDSREIAKAVGVSYQTVIVHRKNIRKKLGIKKSKQNLATYLQQNM